MATSSKFGLLYPSDHTCFCYKCESVDNTLRQLFYGIYPENVKTKHNRNRQSELSFSYSDYGGCRLCRKLRNVLGLSSVDPMEFKIEAVSTLNTPTPNILDRRDESILETGLTAHPNDRSKSTPVPGLFRLYGDLPELREKELILTLEPYPRLESSPQAQIQLIQPCTVDLDFAKQCLEKCEKLHGNICNNPDRSFATVNSQVLLLDLEDCCLVWSTVESDYVALSYVWGPQERDDSSFDCRKKNLKRFLEPGSLKDREFFAVPPLILDAIRFVSQMGKRYLWVDRYCIVQDDGRHKHEQVMTMGMIYARACFTLVSADRDARSGLPGLTRARKSNVLYRNAKFQVVYAVRHISTPLNGIWTSRGWTFQEELFSRRMAIFFDNRLIWKCRTSVCQEELRTIFITHNRGQRSFIDNFKTPKWPDMELFQHLVEDYSKRTLSFPCDSLSAFQGVLSVLHRSFAGGFLFGLPELFFDIALLWQPKSKLQDRMVLAADAGTPVHTLPSWSWCRWLGELNLGPWSAAGECQFLEPYTQNTCKVTPIVAWFKINAQSGAKKYISNWYSAYRGWDQSRFPLSGWQIMPPAPATKNHVSYDDHTDTIKFQQTNSDQSTAFRFPIPLQPFQTILDATLKEENWDTKIFGKVQHSFLFLGGLVSHSPQKEPLIGRCEWRYIMSESRNTVGVVCTNTSETLEKHSNNRLATSPYHYFDDELAQFIAISQGEFRMQLGLSPSVGFSEDNLQDWELGEWSESGVYAFYNVMWIEMMNGIAYRKALGRVGKAFWDSLEPEQIEIMLG